MNEAGLIGIIQKGLQEFLGGRPVEVPLSITAVAVGRTALGDATLTRQHPRGAGGTLTTSSLSLDMEKRGSMEKEVHHHRDPFPQRS